MRVGDGCVLLRQRRQRLAECGAVRQKAMLMVLRRSRHVFVSNFPPIGIQHSSITTSNMNSKSSVCVLGIAVQHDINRTNFLSDFVSDGESANAKRRVYENM